MGIVIRENGFVEALEEREGRPWRCSIMPGDEASARAILGDDAERVIASWTPEQIEAARLPFPEPDGPSPEPPAYLDANGVTIAQAERLYAAAQGGETASAVLLEMMDL